MNLEFLTSSIGLGTLIEAVLAVAIILSGLFLTVRACRSVLSLLRPKIDYETQDDFNVARAYRRSSAGRRRSRV